MRGKHEPVLIGYTLARITPAHAGKTYNEFSIILDTWDHPRACGENIQPVRLVKVSKGSPPRMRGKHTPTIFYLLRFRITPAHAGKTVETGMDGAAEEDHPRACGEN